MSDKKHIDRLFQEGLKDFEAKPSDDVWKNIKANLDNDNKKRRFIPIWWRYAGVAALLLLFLTLSGSIFNNSSKQSQPQVVDTKHTVPETKNQLNTTKAATHKNIGEPNNNNNNSVQDNLNHVKSKTLLNKQPLTIAKTITNTSAIKSTNQNNMPAVSINKNSTFKTSGAKPHTNNTIANLKSKVIHYGIKLKNIIDKKSTNPYNGKNNALIAYSNTEEKLNTPETNTSALESSQKEITATSKTDKKNKNAIEDAILASKEALVEQENKNNRWQVKPNIAPVYFNSAGNGSSIDPQFNNNNISGDINMSIGISTSYAITKKVTIRSGLNNVNLGYNINDVTLFETIGRSSNSSALKNVNTNSDRISIVSSTNLGTNAVPGIVTTNASINQNLRFIELPVEIQYALSNKKLGVNLIGGFSSFFLNSSKVFYEETNGSRTILGKANNLNNLSYSANFGLGLDYKISKRLNLNLEPIFKYQFNTFNNTFGNFTPFFIGVYTGVSVKF